MAKEQHVRNCTWFESTHSDAVGGLAEIEAGKAAGAVKITGAVGTPGNPIEVNVGTVFTSSAVSTLSTTCPGDITISLGGNQFAVPLAQACDVLQMLGNIAVALTVLSCMAWLTTRGV